MLSSRQHRGARTSTTTASVSFSYPSGQVCLCCVVSYAGWGQGAFRRHHFLSTSTLGTLPSIDRSEHRHHHRQGALRPDLQRPRRGDPLERGGLSAEHKMKRQPRWRCPPFSSDRTAFIVSPCRRRICCCTCRRVLCVLELWAVC